MTTYLIDKFVSDQEAQLQVGDLGLQRGYAIFDFLRTVNRIPLFLDDHLARFHQSASIMHMEMPGSNALKEIIFQLIDRNNLGSSGIKMILTGGYSPDGYSLAKPNLIVTQFPIQMPEPARYESGMKVMSYAYERQMPEVKTTNYLMGIWLQEKRLQNGAGDVLFHKNGRVTEFPRSNVFIVTEGGNLATPANNILEGITRKNVLKLAEKDITVELRNVGLDEVKNAAEVFFTNSTHRVFPVVQVDDVYIGNGKPGPVTLKLLEGFLELEAKYLETHRTSNK